MIEEIVIGLAIHVGKWAFDSFTKPGGTRSAAIQQGPGVVLRPKNEAAHRRPDREILRGRLFIQHRFRRTMRGNEDTFIFVMSAEAQQPVILGPLSTADEYVIHISPGTYTIYAVLVDSAAMTFSDAEIYGFGFPCSEHLSSAFRFNEPAGVWDMVNTSPTTISRGGGPYNLHFLVVAASDLPGRPTSFAALEAISDTAQASMEDDGEHVIEDEEGQATPEAGYDWVSKRNARDLRVIWQPGSEHPDHDHVLAGDEEGTWVAEAGYDWVNKRNTADLRVKWQPGVEHQDHDHVIAADEEGIWEPASRYEWLNDRDNRNWRVKRSKPR